MCNNCIHAPVCGKCKATGGQVGKCEHFKEEKWIKELEKRIADLEGIAVRMQYHDDIVNQKRVFEIRYCNLLDPEEAMDIFYKSPLLPLIEEGVADLHCRSDHYLAEEIWRERNIDSTEMR